MPTHLITEYKKELPNGENDCALILATLAA